MGDYGLRKGLLQLETRPGLAMRRDAWRYFMAVLRFRRLRNKVIDSHEIPEIIGTGIELSVAMVLF